MGSPNMEEGSEDEAARQQHRRIEATMALSAADTPANTLRALVAEQHDEIVRLRAALRLAKSVPHGCSTGFFPCWCES